MYSPPIIHRESSCWNQIAHLSIFHKYHLFCFFVNKKKHNLQKILIVNLRGVKLNIYLNYFILYFFCMRFANKKKLYGIIGKEHKWGSSSCTLFMENAFSLRVNCSFGVEFGSVIPERENTLRFFHHIYCTNNSGPSLSLPNSLPNSYTTRSGET